MSCSLPFTMVEPFLEPNNSSELQVEVTLNVSRPWYKFDAN